MLKAVGIITILLVVIGFILSVALVGAVTETDIFSLLFGLVLPVLYILGASKNAAWYRDNNYQKNRRAFKNDSPAVFYVNIVFYRYHFLVKPCRKTCFIRVFGKL